MPDTPPLSRRSLLSAGATLLASAGVAAILPGGRALAASLPTGASPATGAGGSTSASPDLALYRPVAASSTDYAPTPASFAVDGLADTGVRGSGWRAVAGDPQWIAVDLQVPCQVEAVTLVFEAVAGDPPFDGNYGNTSGGEILSSAAVAFTIDVSTDGNSWHTVHETTGGTGGTQAITLDSPVTARWVRMTSTQRTNSNPVGLNGFQVYGRPSAPQPAVTGWTDWVGGNPHPAPLLSLAPDGTVPLESGWALTLDEFAPSADGAALSTGTLDVSGWLPATVPGTVLGSLVAQGHLPDPVSGFNNLHVPEALSRHGWWYRRSLRLPRGLDTSAGRHVWLEFDGINHQATAWVNGVEVGTVTHPFARAAFDITAALAAASSDEHVIAVQVTPMPHPGTPGDKSSNGNTFVQGGHLYLDSPTYLAASGWDWMPAVRDRVTGIWDHVRLRSTGPAVLGDPHVVTTLPDLPDTGTAEVSIEVPVRNVTSSDLAVTVRASFGAVHVASTVAVPAGATKTVTFDPSAYQSLRLRDPKLWWPNGYGDPNLHDLSLSATVRGTVSDHRATRFGIRQFGYDYIQPVVVSPPAKPPLTFTNDHAIQTVTFDAQHAQYVRIFANTRATGWGVSMWTLSVLDGANGPDLALHQTATSSNDENSTNVAANVVDGDPSTRWSSSYQDNQWVQVDLGSAQDFDQVVIDWEAAYALTFTVQVSADGNTFTDVASVTNETPIGDTAVQTETFAPQTAQHLRIQCGGRVTSWGVSMWTLSVQNGNGPDLALNQTATASSVDSDSDGPGNAVDGNPRTRWSSGYEDNQWIQIDFSSAVTFDTVTIAWEQAYARDYIIQVSDDGSNWTNVKSVSNAIVQMKVTVNGVPVFCRGGNWGWDELLRRVLPDRLADTVAMHRDMNFTMIRNWLGSSNREELYRACDEQGILVWNDFWEAGTFLDDQPGYLDIVADTIRRYRVHPCIVVWCGANEEVPPPDLDAGMAKAVKDEDGEVIYISNSAGGIVSGHGPYRWIDPATYNDKSTYDTDAFGFHTEIGMPVVSVPETMANLVGTEPGWPISEVWNYHDWSPIGNQQTGGYQDAIDARLGASTSMPEFATKAQFVNYESHRAMFESWNANLWNDATGLLLWMSHPAWYSTVWQTYDYDLDVNGAYYGSRKACEPQHVQADPGTWQVRAVNHTTSPLHGAIVTASRFDLAGRQIGATQRQVIDVAASAGTAAFTVAAAPDHQTLSLVRLELRDRSNRLLSDNTYWQYAQPSDMQALNTLRATRLGLITGSRSRSGDRTSMTATVSNRGGSVAALVRLALRDRDGNRVLPTQYGDNYFWLLPGEVRQIVVSWPSRITTPGARLTAEAYNSAGASASA